MKTRIPVLLSLLALSAACGKKDKAVERLDTFPVKTVAVEKRDVEETVVLVGSVKAKDEATLFSRVPGKLLRNALQEGASVKKGEAVSFVERDEVGVRFEPAPVPSTLDGVVARVYLDQGQNVTLGTPVALVVDASALYARADVPERYAGRVRVGQAVRLKTDAWPDRVFRGTVSRVSPVVDPVSRSALIETRLDAGSGLRSGMFGELTLVLGSSGKAVAVPTVALTDGGAVDARESGWAVFVCKDGKVRKREVELGLRNDEFTEIRKGVEPGEQVVTFGLYGLKDGSPVEVLDGPVPAAGPGAAGAESGK
ncbi:MAG: efflux RND transporter periplasmic adaptor subunit [Elusimicrobiota bacterium]|jgi:multidrug efflux pump subunit AcrA (membrane-fusion protein)